MALIIAIDYGTKKTGIATTDGAQSIASPLETVTTQKLIDFIENYCNKNEVVCIVVGRPLQKDGTPSKIEPHIKGFVRKIKSILPTITITREDERYTSKMAFQAMIDGGVSKKKRRDKTMIDKISAAIILQSYLEKSV